MCVCWRLLLTSSFNWSKFNFYFSHSFLVTLKYSLRNIHIYIWLIGVAAHAVRFAAHLCERRKTARSRVTRHVSLKLTFYIAFHVVVGIHVWKQYLRQLRLATNSCFAGNVPVMFLMYIHTTWITWIIFLAVIHHPFFLSFTLTHPKTY